MVFFTCNACGESLKKASVEKHYLTKCRACEVLSCIDCGKDFYGDGYKEHTSCISEDQKYGGKNFKAAPQKGVAKQSSWMEIVREASLNPSLKPAVRDAMRRIVDAGYDNIPRKKAKFVNFLGNSLRIRGDWLVDEIWNVIDSHAAAQKQALEAQSSSKDDIKPGTTPMPEPSPEPETAVTNGETGHKKKKKNKKREKTASEDDPGSENGAIEESRRKRKRQGDPMDVKEVSVPPDQVEEQPRKKKKKKHEAEKGKGNGEVDQSGSSEVTDRSQEGSKLSGKKKRKKKKKGTVEDDDEGQRESHPGEGKDRLSGEAEEGMQETVDEHLSMDQDGQHQTQNKKFPWEAVITEVLKNAGGEMKLKKLKKKVLTEFMSRGGDPSLSTEEKVMAKFNKKVLKNPRLKVYKEIVHLKS